MRQWKWLQSIHILSIVILVGYIGVQLFNKVDLHSLSYPFILLGLLLGSLLFYVYVKEYAFQISLFLVAFVSGIYGFSTETTNYPPLNALYSTFRLFVLDVDAVVGNSPSKFNALPLSLEIARWTAALSTISALYTIAFGYIGQSLLRFKIRFSKKHIVVFGYHPNSKILIENLRKDNHSVVVIADSLALEERNHLQEIKVSYYTGNHFKESLYKLTNLKNADYIILFYADDSKNIDTFLALKDYGVSQKFTNSLDILVHLEHPKSEQLFDHVIREVEAKQEWSFLKPRTFNVYQLIAEKQLATNPLYKGYELQLRSEQGEGLHLLFIGFGKVNQRIAFHALQLAHFITRQKIKFTILDRDMERVKKEWSFLAKNVDKVADVTFEAFDLDSQFLSDFLEAEETDITQVFISLKDDFLDMIEGLDLPQIFGDIPIFIKMREDRFVSEWLHRHTDEYHSVKRYAFYHEVLNSEYVLNKGLYQLAENAHQNYQELRKEKGLKPQKEWQELTSLKKESNRLQMLHNDTKLMLLGLEKVPMNPFNQDVLSEAEFLEYILPYTEALAEVEHQRWNAFHYLRGWNTYENFDPEHPVSEARKLHNCLVSWEKLEDVSEKTGRDYKEYDRDSIRQLRLYMEAQKFGLVVKDK